ncbi:MAG: F0F1 ATP synthase subunit delta [Rhodospirillales bacterium]
MSSEIAGRYATALYDLADDGKKLDEVAEDLRGLQQMLTDSDDLTRLVRSPLSDRDEQGRAMSAVLKKAGATDLVTNFIGVVARNGRLFALADMCNAYLKLLASRRGEVTAEVTSAVKLTAAQEKAVADALKGQAGGKVAVETSVDPGLLGGLVIRVGSRMIDTSIRTKLQQMRLAMKGVG